MTGGGASRRIVPVDLAGRGYDIVIGDGLLQEAGNRILELFPDSRAVIVSDRTVDALHGSTLRESLNRAGIQHSTLTVPPGERSKSYQQLQTVCEGILAADMERGDVLIALGGGVVGDLAGFAAGIVRRGMPFVQVPTSLLAQVDSSVGGKTGINSTQGKNLIGLFNQPALVLVDTATFETLPQRERRAGYAEIAKYGLIDRPDLFAWLEENSTDVLAGGDALVYAISASCEAKAAVVMADEREQGRRALLNLGHTFGHALEAAVGYDSERLVHGEGVAIGMVLAFEFSNRLNHCGPEAAGRVRSHLRSVGLPVEVRDVPGERLSLDTLMSAIAQDKKVRRGALTFILAQGIGEAFVAHDVPASEVERFLSAKLSG